MDPKTILGINAIIAANKPKTFEKLRLLVNQSDFKEISDEALAAFGLRPAEPKPVVEKQTIKKTVMKEIRKSLLSNYMEAVSDLKRLKEVIFEENNLSDAEVLLIVKSKIDETINKHTILIKESDIWA